jgi:hypothetical protein
MLTDCENRCFITVDAGLNPPGSTMVNLLAPDRQVQVEGQGRAANKIQIL